MRDLYRGGPLSDYNQGWNDGVEAAEQAEAEILRLQNEVANRNARAIEGDKAVAAFNAEYERAEKAEAENKTLIAYRKHDQNTIEFVNNVIARKEAELAAIKAALIELHAAYKAGGWATDGIEERHAEALRDVREEE